MGLNRSVFRRIATITEPAWRPPADGLQDSRTPPIPRIPCSGRAIGLESRSSSRTEARSKASPYSKEPRDELASSVVELRASLNSPILRTGPIADQLVGVWALAEQVDPEAARPAEALLYAMEGCDLVSAGQVCAACDQVEAALKRPARSR